MSSSSVLMSSLRGALTNLTMSGINRHGLYLTQKRHNGSFPRFLFWILVNPVLGQGEVLASTGGRVGITELPNEAGVETDLD